jgi:hypothetical protein
VKHQAIAGKSKTSTFYDISGQVIYTVIGDLRKHYEFYSQACIRRWRKFFCLMGIPLNGNYSAGHASIEDATFFSSFRQRCGEERELDPG